VLPRFIDFRKIKQKSTHQRDIIVQNNGKTPISITDISLELKKLSSISPNDPFILKPGESKTLVLTLSPGTFSKAAIYGSVTFKTDLEDIPKKSTRFRAYIFNENK